MSANNPLSRRIAMALMSGLLLVSVGATGVLAQSPSPVGSPVIEEPFATPDPVDGATPAVPNPEIVDPKPTPWERVEVAPDGRTLTVYFMNGASGCYGLKDVEVSTVDGVTTLTVLAGLTPEAMFTTCDTGLYLFKTTVVLDAPVLGDGAV